MNKWLTVKEVVELTGRSERTVRLWIHKELVQVERNGVGRVRVERESVKELLGFKGEAK